MLATLMPPPIAAVILAAAALGACSDGTEPFATLLHGQWGSNDVSLVAINSGAEVQLQCTLFVIEDGIELDANNRFSVQGSRQSNEFREKPSEVRVTGELTAAGGVNLTFPDPSTGETVTRQLEAGVVPVLELICPQPTSRLE
jgi:hypothetical protein